MLFSLLSLDAGVVGAQPAPTAVRRGHSPGRAAPGGDRAQQLARRRLLVRGSWAVLRRAAAAARRQAGLQPPCNPPHTTARPILRCRRCGAGYMQPVARLHVDLPESCQTFSADPGGPQAPKSPQRNKRNNLLRWRYAATTTAGPHCRSERHRESHRLTVGVVTQMPRWPKRSWDPWVGVRLVQGVGVRAQGTECVTWDATPTHTLPTQPPSPAVLLCGDPPALRRRN